MSAAAASRVARVTVAVTCDERDLLRWYARHVERPISPLLRLMSLAELLEAARRLKAKGGTTRRDRLRAVAEEAKRLADRADD